MTWPPNTRCQLVFGLAPTNLETLAWSVQYRVADPLRYLGPLVQLFGGAGADHDGDRGARVDLRAGRRILRTAAWVPIHR